MSLCLSVDQFLRIVPGHAPSRVLEILAPMESACVKWGIDTKRRLAAAIAQWGHETQGFRAFVERWGPTEQQKKYDPPGKLAERLGNTSSGDGFKYRGRGASMLTGLRNYREMGVAIGWNLVDAPELVERLDVGFEVAGAYWKSRKVNGPADLCDFSAVTILINGGLTHYAERLKIYTRACSVLGVDIPKPRGAA